VAELAHIISVPTVEAAATVLIGEHEEALRNMAASILEVYETGQDRVRGDLHGKMHHTVEHVP
jgi:hypothetical protein